MITLFAPERLARQYRGQNIGYNAQKYTICRMWQDLTVPFANSGSLKNLKQDLLYEAVPKSTLMTLI